MSSFDNQQSQMQSADEEKERRRRVAGAWLWGGALVALFTLGGGLYYGGVFKKRADRQKVESAYFFRVDGKDKQSRPASFDFIILTDDYTWARGSSTEVISKGQAVPESEAADRVLTPVIRSSLSSASDLIAVGLSSSEGEKAAEEQRALSRAQTIQSWMRKLTNPGISLWTMTFGQYNKDCKKQEDADSSFERPLIFVGVRSKAEGVNLQEALADAISGHSNLPSRDCYSRFEMTKAR